MEIAVLNTKDYDSYEEFLLSDINTLFYYSTKYKLFLEKILECKSEYLLVKDDNQVYGVLPLMYEEGCFGRVYNSLPFYGSNGGIFAKNENAYKLLSEKYKKLVLSPDVASGNYIENPLIKQENNTKIVSNETDYRIGQFTPLALELNKEAAIEDALMDSFHYKTRNMIRKALKNDIKTKISTNEMGFLNEIHIKNMLAIGGKPKKDAFFNEIPNFFEPEKDYRIYVAEKDGGLIAALLLFYYNKTVEYFTPVIREEYRSLQPMSVLIYQAMIDASKENYHYWNWGGTWQSQEGVFRFKNRWNTKNIDYKYHIQINNEAIYNATKEELLNEYPDFYVLPFEKLR